MKEEYIGYAIFIIALLAIPVSIYLVYNPPKAPVTREISYIIARYISGYPELSNISENNLNIRLIRVDYSKYRNISKIVININIGNSGLIIKSSNESILEIYSRYRYLRETNGNLIVFSNETSRIEYNENISFRKLIVTINAKNTGILIKVNPDFKIELSIKLSNGIGRMDLSDLKYSILKMKLANCMFRGDLKYKEIYNNSIYIDAINCIAIFEIHGIDFKRVQLKGSSSNGAVLVYSNDRLMGSYADLNILQTKAGVLSIEEGGGYYRITANVRNSLIELRFYS